MLQYFTPKLMSLTQIQLKTALLLFYMLWIINILLYDCIIDTCFISTKIDSLQTVKEQFGYFVYFYITSTFYAFLNIKIFHKCMNITVYSSANRMQDETVKQIKHESLKQYNATLKSILSSSTVSRYLQENVTSRQQPDVTSIITSEMIVSFERGVTLYPRQMILCLPRGLYGHLQSTCDVRSIYRGYYPSLNHHRNEGTTPESERGCKSHGAQNNVTRRALDGNGSPWYYRVVTSKDTM